MKDGDVRCPTCGGECWDRRLTKRSPYAPDFTCRNPACTGAIWPEKTPRRGNAMDEQDAPRASKPSKPGDTETGDLF